MDIGLQIKQYIINWVKNGVAENPDMKDLLVTGDYPKDKEPDIVVSYKKRTPVLPGAGTYVDYNQITQEAMRVFIDNAFLSIASYSTIDEEAVMYAENIRGILTNSRYVPVGFNSLKDYSFANRGFLKLPEVGEAIKVDSGAEKKWKCEVSMIMQIGYYVHQKGIYDIVANNMHIK